MNAPRDLFDRMHQLESELTPSQREAALDGAKHRADNPYAS